MHTKKSSEDFLTTLRDLSKQVPGLPVITATTPRMELSDTNFLRSDQITNKALTFRYEKDSNTLKNELTEDFQKFALRQRTSSLPNTQSITKYGFIGGKDVLEKTNSSRGGPQGSLDFFASHFEENPSFFNKINLKKGNMIQQNTGDFFKTSDSTGGFFKFGSSIDEPLKKDFFLTATKGESALISKEIDSDGMNHILKEPLTKKKKNFSLSQSSQTHMNSQCKSRDTLSGLLKPSHDFSSLKERFDESMGEPFIKLKVQKMNDYKDEPLKNYDFNNLKDWNPNTLLEDGPVDGFSRWLDIDGKISWRPCLIIGYEPQTELFKIRWKNSTQEKEVNS